MPRKSTRSPTPGPIRSRRSAGVPEFVALDLYSNGKEALNFFKADENHNGIKVEPVSAKKSPAAATTTPSSVVPTKRVRAASVVIPPSDMAAAAKRMKRESSVSTTMMTQSSVVVVADPKRGRPKGSGKTVTKSPPRSKSALPARERPAKTPKREPASSPETDVVVVAPKRGRPKGSVNKSVPPAAKSAVTKTPEKKRAATMAKRLTKTPKRELGVSSVESQSSVAMVVAPKRGRPKGSSNKTSAAAKSTPRGRVPAKNKMTAVKQELPSDGEMEQEGAASEHDDETDDDDDEEMDVKPDPKAMRPVRSSETAAVLVKKRVQSAINEMAMVHNSQLSWKRQKDVVARLVEVASCATTMTALSYDNVMNNLTLIENAIKSNGNISSPDSDLQDKVTSLEAEQATWQREKAALMVEMSKTGKTLEDNQKTLEDIQQKLDIATKKVEETKEEKDAMEKLVQHFKDRLDELERSAQHSVVSSSSSPAYRSPRNDAPGPSSTMTPAIYNNNGYNSYNQPIIPTPAPPSFDLQSLPRGSAIGHTTMAGRAAELIAGINHLEGLEDAYASVAVTAATLAETDAYGNVTQRTVRTRVERIAVPEGMSVQQLQELGYQIAHTGETSDEDEDEEEEEHNESNGHRIEEVNGAVYNDFGSENGEEGGPLIEEAE